MVEAQNSENAAFKNKRETSKIEVAEEQNSNTQPKRVGRPKKIQKISRSKSTSFLVDVDTLKDLNFLKIEYEYDIKDVIYVLIRDFLEKNFQNRVLSEEGKAFLEERLKDL